MSGNPIINKLYVVVLPLKFDIIYHANKYFTAPGVIKYWKEKYFYITSDGLLSIYDEPKGEQLKCINISDIKTELKVCYCHIGMILLTKKLLKFNTISKLLVRFY